MAPVLKTLCFLAENVCNMLLLPWYFYSAVVYIFIKLVIRARVSIFLLQFQAGNWYDPH